MDVQHVPSNIVASNEVKNDMSSQATEPQPATRCAVPTKGCIQKNNLPWYGNKRLPNLV